jgi:hypothetical protein
MSLTAIRSQFGTSEGEDGVNLFVKHHSEEIGRDYYLRHLGSATPEPVRVLDLLVFQLLWEPESEDSLDTLDFSLPEEITNYVIAVSFDEKAQVITISIDS